MKNNKLLYSILIVLLIILLSIGITYAVYTWNGNTFIKGISECFEVNYVKGRDIGSDEILILGEGPLDGLSSTIDVSIDKECAINMGYGTLYLDIDDSTTDVLLSSGALKYQVVIGNNFTCEGVLSNKGRNIICDNIKITNNIVSIISIVWIDNSLVTDTNREEILSSSFSGKINLKVESR
ncbi:MAG: hypothetical protein ACI310_03780 [Bacilli bacterium]